MKCTNCGCLGVILNGELLDTQTAFRDGRATIDHMEIPYCCLRKVEFYKRGSVRPTGEEFAKEVYAERQCDGFIEWRPHFTPREHVMMIEEFMKEQRQSNREWRIAFASAGLGIVGTLLGVWISGIKDKKEDRPVIIQVAPELSAKKAD